MSSFHWRPSELDHHLDGFAVIHRTVPIPFEYERRVRRKDGQYRWFLIQYHPLRDQQGAVIRWYAAGTDINDRKLAEDALRSTEESLRLTVDRIPGLVSSANAAGEV